MSFKTSTSSLRNNHLFHGFVVALLLAFSACSEQGGSSKASLTTKNLPPFNIDLVTAYDQREAIKLSDFAKSVEYIPLATPEEALIGRSVNFYLTENHILVLAFRQVYVFDRETGAFIKEIKKYGKGPDEYNNTIPRTHIDENEGVVFVKDNRRAFLGLDASGEMKIKFKGPGEAGLLISGFARLGDGLIVGFIANYDCARKEKLVIFNEQGEVQKVFDNYQQCVDEVAGRVSFNSAEGSFYHWNDQVLFKETYNDTLFRVTKDSLIVRAIFSADEHAMPYKDRTQVMNDQSANDYYQISRLDESNDHLFFTIRYKGRLYSSYYNKQTNETKVSYNKGAENHYFVNDLDDFIPFKPMYATEDNRLVGFAEAPDIITWFEENPEKAVNLPAPLQALENMQEDDNPVVMIVSLKD